MGETILILTLRSGVQFRLTSSRLGYLSQIREQIWNGYLSVVDVETTAGRITVQVGEIAATEFVLPGVPHAKTGWEQNGPGAEDGHFPRVAVSG